MRDILLRFSLIFAAIIFATSAGCDEKPLAVALNSDVVKGWSYAALASATFESGQSPAPSPAPTPSPGGVCSNCNGTGKVGDGRVFAPCAECGGDGKTQEVLQGCTCEDCKCDPCLCPAQSLTSAPAGLSDCVGGVCRLPKASSGDCPGGVCASPPGAPRAPARLLPRLRLFRR